MQSRMCASRASSLPSLPRGGSGWLQTGQRSRSSIGGRCERETCRGRSGSTRDRTRLCRVLEEPEIPSQKCVPGGPD